MYYSPEPPPEPPEKWIDVMPKFDPNRKKTA
jgi:hypothetical protein